jgi:uncharacterized membrane-anchored protein
MSLPKIGDIKKWSFGEMTSNPDGKTSVTSTSGFIIVIVGSLSFLLGVVDKMFIDKSIDVITQAITFTLIGASLIGVKNYIGGKITQSKHRSDTAIAIGADNSSEEEVK